MLINQYVRSFGQQIKNHQQFWTKKSLSGCRALLFHVSLDLRIAL